MERKRRLRSILAFMLTFAVVLGMVPLPGMTKEAQAADVTSDSTTWNENMTVNEDMTIKSRVTVSGAVTLTLSAGKTLIAKKRDYRSGRKQPEYYRYGYALCKGDRKAPPGSAADQQ